jgi:hypothetical protein
MTQPTQKPDLGKRSRNLRAQTCAFLHIGDYSALSPAEQVCVDKIGALRLEIGDLRDARSLLVVPSTSAVWSPRASSWRR